VLGATLACSVLLDLNETQTANALGLAVAQAAGTRQNFGAMAKSFQAGQCNAAAVRAALMARSGFTASADAIDGRFGYLALYASGEDASSALAALGQSDNGPLEIDAMGIDIKKYPCCYAIHRALDGLLALRKAHALTPENVTKIEITNSAGGLDALLPQPPMNGLQAKFNMAYCMAAALLDGAIRLASFDDVQVMRPEIRAWLPKVSLTEAPGAILPRWSHVRVDLADGRVLEQRVNTARGDAGDPLSDAELIEKVADCFAFGNHDADARAFALRVFVLPEQRVSDAILALHGSK
jgi:2-methylcitrate dehydratase PrpD